jgi:hypothetical protein
VGRRKTRRILLRTSPFLRRFALPLSLVACSDAIKTLVPLLCQRRVRLYLSSAEINTSKWWIYRRDVERAEQRLLDISRIPETSKRLSG